MLFITISVFVNIVFPDKNHCIKFELFVPLPWELYANDGAFEDAFGRACIQNLIAWFNCSQTNVQIKGTDYRVTKYHQGGY